jgi:hypothetical protein
MVALRLRRRTDWARPGDFKFDLVKAAAAATAGGVAVDSDSEVARLHLLNGSCGRCAPMSGPGRERRADERRMSCGRPARAADERLMSG